APPPTRAPGRFKIPARVRAHTPRLPVATTGGERVPVTVSIGVAALDAGSSRELTELLAAADAALYRAKASGRDQVQMISTSRGLSAVRSPAGDDTAMSATAAAMWRPANARQDAELAAGEFEDDEFRLPVADVDSSSATTSAFAV